MPTNQTVSWKGKFKYDPVLYKTDNIYKEQVEYAKYVISFYS